MGKKASWSDTQQAPVLPKAAHKSHFYYFSNWMHAFFSTRSSTDLPHFSFKALHQSAYNVISSFVLLPLCSLQPSFIPTDFWLISAASPHQIHSSCFYVQSNFLPHRYTRELTSAFFSSSFFFVIWNLLISLSLPCLNWSWFWFWQEDLKTWKVPRLPVSE